MGGLEIASVNQDTNPMVKSRVATSVERDTLTYNKKFCNFVCKFIL